MEGPSKPKRHSELYAEDFVIILVQDTLFRLPVKYFAESPPLQDMFSLATPKDEEREGQSDEKPIKGFWEDEHEFAFTAKVLRMIYDYGRRPAGSKKDWISVLTFAHKWQMVDAVKDTCLEVLAEKGMLTPFELVMTCDRFDIGLDNVSGAIFELMKQWGQQPLSMKMRMGHKKHLTSENWEVIAFVHEHWSSLDLRWTVVKEYRTTVQRWVADGLKEQRPEEQQQKDE